MIKPFFGNYPITQIFGNKLILNGKDIYGQWGLLGHNGVDYGLPTDTPLITPHHGKVIEAAFDRGGYGWYTKIENDVEGSILAHMKSKPHKTIWRAIMESRVTRYSAAAAVVMASAFVLFGPSWAPGLISGSASSQSSPPQSWSL